MTMTIRPDIDATMVVGLFDWTLQYAFIVRRGLGALIQSSWRVEHRIVVVASRHTAPAFGVAAFDVSVFHVFSIGAGWANGSWSSFLTNSARISRQKTLSPSRVACLASSL